MFVFLFCAKWSEKIKFVCFICQYAPIWLLTFKTLESQQIDPEMSGSLNKNAEIINT